MILLMLQGNSYPLPFIFVIDKRCISMSFESNFFSSWIPVLKNDRRCQQQTFYTNIHHNSLDILWLPLL